MRLPRFESLYAGFTFSLPWVVKFGRGIIAEKRWKNIKADLDRELGYSVNVYVFHMPVLFAQQCENLLAYLYGKWKFRGLKYSTGRTEFYYFVNLITSVLVGGFVWWQGGEAPHWKALFFLVAPLPIDAYLIVLLIALVQYAIIGGLFWALLSFLNIV